MNIKESDHGSAAVKPMPAPTGTSTPQTPDQPHQSIITDDCERRFQNALDVACRAEIAKNRCARPEVVRA
jgi:hypothetical protein